MIKRIFSIALLLSPTLSWCFHINPQLRTIQRAQNYDVTASTKLQKKEMASRNDITNLKMTTSSSTGDEIDTTAIFKYISSIGIQMVGLATSFYMLDLGQDPSRNMSAWPLPVVFGIFYFLSLRSRLLSPLDNKRPDLKEATKGEATRGFGDRVMPSWTPPGVFFPIMWILIIAPLRSYSSLIVYEQTGGHFFNMTLLALMLHLSVGDTWNTINNVEKRIGASVPGVLCVLASAAFASYQYYQVDPFAGKLLGATCIWLTIASALIIDTWRLNPRGEQKDALFPVKGDAETKFIFESFD